MRPKITKKQFFLLILIMGLAVVLFLTLRLAGTRQELRKRAGSSGVQLKLYPATDSLQIGAVKSFDLIATFTGPQTGETIDYLLTEVSFDKNYLEIPVDKPVQTAFANNQVNFTKIFRVDTPQEANAAGKVVVELGTATKGGGPSTSSPVTVARIFFKGRANTPSSQNLTIRENSLIVNNQSAGISVTTENTSYTVGVITTVTGPTATRTPTVTGPTATRTPTVTGPTATRTPTVTQGPSPTPGGASNIDIGDKDDLTINIGPATTSVPTPVITPPPGGFVQISFKVKLANTQNNPDMNMKLRVKDELAFVNDADSGTGGTCNNPASGEKDFVIPVKAVDGNYVPATSDGWFILEGIIPGRYYTLILKAPKTRGEKMAEHVVLTSGKPQTQLFDWINEPLDPGDLPNPNDDGKQDCTVNSIDLSLITDRIGATDEDALKVADVNYDGVINGSDVSKVVNTLSTKPDDDL